MTMKCTIIIKRIAKGICVIPIYIILVLEGFCGGMGTTGYQDIWNEVVDWIKK